jgi:hypothetical protein
MRRIPGWRRWIQAARTLKECPAESLNDERKASMRSQRVAAFASFEGKVSPRNELA